MNNTARRFQQHETPENDNENAYRKPKLHILPSGKESFVRADGLDPKRKGKRPSRGRKPWSPGKVASTANLYLSDIQKLIYGRHGGPCDTDEGDIYLSVAIPLMVQRFKAMEDSGRNPKAVDAQAWSWKHAAKLAEERPQAWFREMERRITEGLNLNPSPLPSADDIARELQITHAEVIAFKLRSVGAVDRLAPQRNAEEKVKRAFREKDRRAKAKAIPRSESMARTRPWEAFGVSEPTFRRWVRDGKVPPHPSQKRAKVGGG